MTDADQRITSLDAIPADTTHLFTVRTTEGAEREAILVRTDGGVSGWLNSCRHLLDVRLDKGSGAPIRDGELVCANHGAYFEADTGYCTFGPCEGATLEAIAVTVEDGDVYLTDDGYAFVRDGSAEADTGPSPSETYEF